MRDQIMCTNDLGCIHYLFVRGFKAAIADVVTNGASKQEWFLWHNANLATERLLRDMQRRQAEEKLEAMVLAGLNSGDPNPVPDEFWAERRRRSS